MICRSPSSTVAARKGSTPDGSNLQGPGTCGDILEERVKPQVKGALRHAILSVAAKQPGASDRAASTSGAISAGHGGGPVKEELTLMSADFLLDHHLDVHLVAFQGDPDIEVSATKVNILPYLFCVAPLQQTASSPRPDVAAGG